MPDLFNPAIIPGTVNPLSGASMTPQPSPLALPPIGGAPQAPQAPGIASPGVAPVAPTSPQDQRTKWQKFQDFNKRHPSAMKALFALTASLLLPGDTKENLGQGFLAGAQLIRDDLNQKRQEEQDALAKEKQDASIAAQREELDIRRQNAATASGNLELQQQQAAENTAVRGRQLDISEDAQKLARERFDNTKDADLAIRETNALLQEAKAGQLSDPLQQLAPEERIIAQEHLASNPNASVGNAILEAKANIRRATRGVDPIQEVAVRSSVNAFAQNLFLQNVPVEQHGAHIAEFISQLQQGTAKSPPKQDTGQQIRLTPEQIQGIQGISPARKVIRMADGREIPFSQLDKKQLQELLNQLQAQ